MMVVAALLCCVNLTWAQQTAEPVTLPTGWRLTPAGHHLPLGDLPLNMAVSPNKRWLAVTNNGYGRQCVKIFDTKKEQEVDDQTLSRSWYGLCFSPDGKRLYASGGNNNDIRIFNVSNQGKLTLADSIVLGKKWPTRISPSGMATNPKNGDLYVVTRWNNSLYVYDKTGHHLLHQAPLGGEGYQVIVSSDGRYAYASCWGCERVKVWDTQKAQWIYSIPVGSHPNEMCLDEKSQRLYVANANDNSVSVINLKEYRVEETLNAALFPGSLSGSTTNGLCLLDNGRKLAIANADNNCVTLFDVSQPGSSRSLGFIPVGWYPTNVKFVNNKLWVTNGKGLRSLPNPHGPKPVNKREKFGHHSGDAGHNKKVEYIGGLFLGALSIIDVPNEEQLERYTAQVFANTPYDKKKEMLSDSEPGNPIPSKVGQASPIKYVFYVIKENRTYDQVLGDMPQGNGDPSLTLFGRDITPNQHKLASDFVLLDNFYVNAEVSCDGHNWTTGAYANDYLEKVWPTSYSGRGDVYAGEGGHHMGNNKSGFIWDQCRKYGVTYRTYGEFVARKTKNKKKLGITPKIPSLEGHFCPNYEPFNLGVPDTTRFRAWAADFDSLLAAGKVPQFNTVRLGNDHTEGMKLGRPTPYAHVADNDLALGMFLDHLSHSPIWKETVVFIIEDDAQNGSDHVDAHRSTAYLAGGMVKRHYVDSTPYTTTSMVRTIELILGMPPMTQHDSSARVMWKSFTSQVDDTPFNHLPANVPLDEKNEKRSKWQAMSEKYNFEIEDDVPDVEFNKVLWHGIKGDSVSYPPLRRSAFLTYSMVDDDDDD
jgi:DNA-binding beta-propeller fold protein YncE